MAKQTIGVGTTANDGTGDTLRNAMIKINANTDELYTDVAAITGLADNSVTTAKLVDGNVTAAKLASNAVTTTKILDANVTAAKLATNAITTTAIADDQVTEAKLAPAVVAQLGGSPSAPEGSTVLSTGETNATKFLREDGDGTCSWQVPAGAGDVVAANNFSEYSATLTAARAGLGLAIGTDVQAHAAVLDATTASFLIADETKLDAINTSVDVRATNYTVLAADFDAGKTIWVNANTLTIPVLGADQVGKWITIISDASMATAKSLIAGSGVTIRRSAAIAADSEVALFCEATDTFKMVVPADAAGVGDVAKVGTPADGEIGVWTGDGTIEGQTVAEVKATINTLTLNPQTGTTYTTVLSDAQSVKVSMSNAASNTVTIADNASVAYPAGTQIHFEQLGAGATTIAIAGTDTLNVNAALTLVLNGQYAVATAVKNTATTWTLFGNLVAA